MIAWRDRTKAFEGLAAFTGASCVLTGSAGAEEDPCEVIESRLFPLLGVTPFLGRTFTAEEDQANGARAVILSYGLWQRRFGADSAAIGMAIEINGSVHTIVGVMPAGFSHLYSSPYAAVPQLWISGIGLQPTNVWNDYMAVGRFKPGVTPDSAQAELDAVSEQVEQAHPDLKGWRAEFTALRDVNAGDTAPALLVLVAAVVFVLLIACANVANLLLARGTARASEMAVRKALGAGRWRVVRQLLTESAVLALAGGALGVIVSSWGITGLLTLAPSYLLNSARGLSGELDVRMLVLAVGISIATTMLFGLAPAWLNARPDVGDTLKETARGAMHPRSHRFRSALLVGQVALAMVLLVGAGLMIRTLANMNAVNLGFNPVGVLTLRVPLEGSRAEPSRVAAFWRDLVKSVEALPGVRSASVARGLPIESWSGQFFVNQDQPNPPAGHVPDANYVVVGPRYFETMQMPLRAGRPFDDHDTAGGLPVVIVNEELARTQWPGQSAIGKRIKMGGPSDTTLAVADGGGRGRQRHDGGPAVRRARGGLRAVSAVPVAAGAAAPGRPRESRHRACQPHALHRRRDRAARSRPAGDGHPDAGRSGGDADGPAADGDGAARRLRRRRARARGAGDLQRPLVLRGSAASGVRRARGARRAAG